MMCDTGKRRLLGVLCLTFTLVGLVNFTGVLLGNVKEKVTCLMSSETARPPPGQQQDIQPREADDGVGLRNFKSLDYDAIEKREEFKPDVWNSTGALDMLKTYNRELNQNLQPIRADPDNVTSITEWWHAAAMINWYLNSTLRFPCPKHLRSFAKYFLCQEPPRVVRKSCYVYTFGVKHDFTFEDFMAWQQCEVWSFDPGMNVTDHLRGLRVHFYNMGLSTANSDVFIRPNIQVKRWKMRTFKAIQQQIGHRDQIIDIVKLNIGGEEWSVLDYLLEHDLVKMFRVLLVHYHILPTWPPRDDYVIAFKTLTRLRQLGYREYYHKVETISLKPNNFTLRAQVYYINANFKWFH